MLEIYPVDDTFGKDAMNRIMEAKAEGREGAKAALETFYYAFNNRSIEVFKQIWFNHPLIQLNNPVGGMIRGIDGITELYTKIFQGSAKVWVEFSDIVEYFSGNTAVFAGKEEGEFLVGNQVIPLKIRTSRFFSYMNGQWVQIHHHGSIDDPNLLSTYQKAVREPH